MGIALCCLNLILLFSQAKAQPVVHADRTVTFTLYSPGAGKVQLNGLPGIGSVQMHKAGEGNWEITVGPFEPDLYSYSFAVDGALTIDPKNRNVKKWRTLNSMVEVPGENPQSLHALKDVPHGTVHRHYYHSLVAGSQRSLLVYTPASYVSDREARFPVLFLLHGFGDDETAWTEVGRAHFIADNLMADERAKPMIIVMPNGHPVLIPDGQRPENYSEDNRRALDAEIRNELIPFLEGHYRIETDASKRAIVGLSMGGGQSLDIGLTHLDLFQWVGGFSSAAPGGNLNEHFSTLKDATSSSRPELLWIACGKEDSLLERNETFVAWLKEQSMQHTWRLTEGGHEWRVWRRYLTELLPLLFR
jgi:enterochelin esterase-like enzyme